MQGGAGDSENHDGRQSGIQCAGCTGADPGASSMGIQWFEEPVVHTDHAGYQLLRNQCGIALAMGEREYDFEALNS